MKINQEMKRKIVQVAAFGYSNTYIGNFVSGQIYKGRWKQFCNPGMNAGRWNSTFKYAPGVTRNTGSAVFCESMYFDYNFNRLSVCRFFCKVMCPLGAIYGLLNKVSICHMECNKKTCVSCGKCHNVCPMDVDPVKNPNSAECIRCGKCVESCPKESLALKFVYGKKG